MELDPPAPYFCDPFEAQGEDFHRSSAPSEDIWKKFELLPSPPASPLPGPPEDAGAEGLPEPAAGLLGNLSAFVLRDCMWSGFSARERLEKARGEKLAPAHDFAGLGGECVAPGAVFAWPGGSAAAAAAAAGAAPADSNIPVSSGSESQSDSEGEEIDVVTVEKRQALGTRKPVTITVRADPLDPCMKHFHIAIHQQQHNYAARSPPNAHSFEGPPEKGSQEPAVDARDDDPQSPGQVIESFSPVSSLPKAGSAPGSDNEDVTKRKNHNYLERKRRNDLRSRFLALRDQVPGLASCPKTPKVVVLSKASKYLQLLLTAEQQMVAEKKLLKLHQLQLLKQISHLQGMQ